MSLVKTRLKALNGKPPIKALFEGFIHKGAYTWGQHLRLVETKYLLQILNTIIKYKTNMLRPTHTRDDLVTIS